MSYINKNNSSFKEKQVKIHEKGDFEITLGSAPSCDYSFTDFKDRISEFHASLKRIGDRLFFKDNRSKQGTFVDGRRIGSKWREVTLHSQVFLGEVPVSIGPTLLLGRDRVGIKANNLYFAIPSAKKTETEGLFRTLAWKFKAFFNLLPCDRVLANHISFNAEPGTLTGIMGPSGAGKTVFLNLLSGYLKPQAGRVEVGMFDVHTSSGLVKDIIGYVPQDDTLIPELTVYQSLHCCLRLGYPDMERAIRQTLIEDVLKRMGFRGERLNELLKTRIGSPDPDQRGLSGGERRRVNIAHELVRNPLLLFLDEPTSGLSSVDSEHVVEMLKDICTTYQKTLIMTIHQPSKEIFEKLDNLLLLNRGGNVAYFGPAAEAVPYFEAITQKPCAAMNPADYVLKVLDNWEGEKPPELYFKESHQTPSTSSEESLPSTTTDKSRALKKRKHNFLFQFFLLSQRNLQVKIADRTSLFLIFFQAVIISLLLFLTFQGYDRDFKKYDTFANAWGYFQTHYFSEGNALYLDKLREHSLQYGRQETGRISELSARQHISILFLLIASSIWFGVVNGSREIVSEKSTLQRESKGPLHLSSYLISKLFVLLLIAVVQTGILICFSLMLLDISGGKFIRFWGILILSSVAASSLSLLVSAGVKTEQASLMAVPILIIPQLFLGGLIRQARFFSQNLVGEYHLSDFILQKWSFISILSVESGASMEALKQRIYFEAPHIFKILKFEPQSLLELFFNNSDKVINISNLMIGFHFFIPLFLTYIILRKRYC